MPRMSIVFHAGAPPLLQFYYSGIGNEMRSEPGQGAISASTHASEEE